MARGSDTDIQAKAAELNARYLHPSEVRYRVPDGEFDAVWDAMRTARSRSCVRFEVCGRAWSLNVTPRMEGILREAEGCRLNLPGADVREAVASACIEGASVSVGDVEGMLRTGREPRNQGEAMALRVLMADRAAEASAGSALTPDLVLRLHGEVMGTGPDPGFRGCDVVVGDPMNGRTRHVPPPHGEVPGLVEDLCRWFGTGTEVHPLIGATLLHYLVAYVHPFEDGNGRLARCLFRWACLRAGLGVGRLPVSEAILGTRGAYGRAYLHTETDGGDLTYFVSYLLGCVERSLGEADCEEMDDEV